MISGELYFKINQDSILSKFNTIQAETKTETGWGIRGSDVSDNHNNVDGTDTVRNNSINSKLREFVGTGFLVVTDTNHSSQSKSQPTASLADKSNERLKELQKIRSLAVKSLIEQRKHVVDGLLPSVVHTYHETIARAQMNTHILKSKIASLKQSVDAELMELVLAYFDILKQEISFNRFSSTVDCSDINAQRNLVETNKKMKFFGLCLNMESSAKVSLSSLPQSSSQSKRCMKAVVENINPCVMNAVGFTGMDVNLVYKLDHSLLSANLQVILRDN
jgi:hypothetical protein